MLLHGSQGIRLFAPLPPAGKLSVVAEVADIQDKGEGKNAIVMLKATAPTPTRGEVVAETFTTAVIRGEGGLRRTAGAAARSRRRFPTASPTRGSHCPPARIRR